LGSTRPCDAKGAWRTGFHAGPPMGGKEHSDGPGWNAALQNVVSQHRLMQLALQGVLYLWVAVMVPSPGAT
jgi:hypothetical protein